MSWLCLFSLCRWRYLGNLELADDAPAGLYQCARCKSLSLGSPTDPHTRKALDELHQMDQDAHTTDGM